MTKTMTRSGLEPQSKKSFLGNMVMLLRIFGSEYQNFDARLSSALSLEDLPVYIMDVDESKFTEILNWPDHQIPVTPAQTFQELASELPYHSAPTIETQNPLNQTSQMMASWTIDEDFLWEEP